MKLYILLIVFLLIGCTRQPPIIVCNNTCTPCIEKTCEVCKAPVICEVCKAPDYSSYVKELAKAGDDLNFCHIQQDILDEMLTECRLRNTSEYAGDLEGNYSICYRERLECENKLGNITEALD